jgi:hypothetical protein
VKYAFMRANRAEFDVKRMCQVLQVSRSGYYDWAGREESKRSQQDRVPAQGDSHDPSGDQGGLRCNQDVAESETAGIVCGRHRVARLRRQAGIESRRKRKFRLGSKARNTAPAAANLLRWPVQGRFPRSDLGD